MWRIKEQEVFRSGTHPEDKMSLSSKGGKRQQRSGEDIEDVYNQEGISTPYVTYC